LIAQSLDGLGLDGFGGSTLLAGASSRKVADFSDKMMRQSYASSRKVADFSDKMMRPVLWRKRQAFAPYAPTLSPRIGA
jgi:hypothetical protein